MATAKKSTPSPAKESSGKGAAKTEKSGAGAKAPEAKTSKAAKKK